MVNNIELEVRAVLDIDDCDRVIKHLEENGTFLSQTRRLMVMFFGASNGHDIDIRIRVTNGAAEMVVKRGDLHGHDRIEEAQVITKDQMVGLSRMTALLGFDSKVGERIIRNYTMNGGVIASLVTAGSVAYIEFEKMSNPESAEKDRNTVTKLLLQTGLKPIETKEEYAKLGQRLTDEVDWKFTGSVEDCERLSTQIKQV